MYVQLDTCYTYIKLYVLCTYEVYRFYVILFRHFVNIIIIFNYFNRKNKIIDYNKTNELLLY
jgi:hypothetical protein